MKKILIGLFALTSAVSFADNGLNFYTKLGFDLSNRYSSVKLEEYYNANTSKKGSNFVGTLALEATKNVKPNLELGLGIAYKAGGKNSELKFSERDVNYAITGTTATIKDFDLKLDIARFRQIPLYLTAKYNFELESPVKPYVKLDLGYSFNKINKNKNTFVVTYTDNHVEVVRTSYHSKVKNSFYTALSAGVEYKNFLTELSYVYTPAKIRSEAGDTFKYKNKAIKLSVGYKFNF